MIPSICERYEGKDIFTTNETSLLYRTVPSRILVHNDNSRHGGILAKKRIIMMTAYSAAGEKLQWLVIGMSAKPRCFWDVK